MKKRYMSIWFPHLITDRATVLHPALASRSIVFTFKERGKLIITAANIVAENQGLRVGMAVADAKAIVPDIQVYDDVPEQAVQLLNAIGEWCIRYTPFVAIDMPDGLFLDISGCTHLWGGEQQYMKDIASNLHGRGYDIRTAIADTPGMAWAVARFGRDQFIIEPGCHAETLMSLPAVSLRLEPIILSRLQKLGFHHVGGFMGIKRSALRRRFGSTLLQRIDQALGKERENIIPIQPAAPYEERLPCLDPIRTAIGIAIALQKLLNVLCRRLKEEEKGMRIALLKCYRIDGKMVQVKITTNRASHDPIHLLKLFDLKIQAIEPALGIELFVLEVSKVENIITDQDSLWVKEGGGFGNTGLIELLDRVANKVGNDAVHRYLPQEHYWPERSIKSTTVLSEKPATDWVNYMPRPTYILTKPEAIDVTVPVPDYPPMLFIYNKELHQIKKADGPERIEREWWIEKGELRDYYTVEDEEGKRYWLFRSGKYSEEEQPRWFIHGFFA